MKITKNYGYDYYFIQIEKTNKTTGKKYYQTYEYNARLNKLKEIKDFIRIKRINKTTGQEYYQVYEYDAKLDKLKEIKKQ